MADLDDWHRPGWLVDRSVHLCNVVVEDSDALLVRSNLPLLLPQVGTKFRQTLGGGGRKGLGLCMQCDIIYRTAGGFREVKFSQFSRIYLDL